MANFIPINKTAQQGVLELYKHIGTQVKDTQSNRRSAMENIDKAYQREVDGTSEQAAAKAANRSGNTDAIQNIVVPVVMPQVETAVEYQSEVFLSGHPIFPVVASPAYMDSANNMGALIEDQSVKGGWAEQLIMMFRNGAKYNFAPLEVSWDTKILHAIETDSQYKGGLEGKPVELKWSGNTLRAVDPYNTFCDTSVAPSEVHTKGEYVGYTENLSRIELLRRLKSLPKYLEANYEDIFSSASTEGDLAMYVPDINSELYSVADKGREINWHHWIKDIKATRGIEYKSQYEWTVLYAYIVPKELGITNVAAKSTPQAWKFYIVNHSVIAYAEKLTDAHGMLPIMIGQPNKDNLSYQTKPLASNSAPFQEVATSLMNGMLASKRRAVNDRLIYDPSRVSSAHINSPNPSAKIPVRPAAFGTNIGNAVYQFPYRADQDAGDMNSIGSLLSMANTAVGQNPARQGQFVKGNKTRDEFTEIMGNSSGRDKLVAITYEAQVFTPLKTVLKSNILQYQGGTTIYDADSKQDIEIDPVELRKAVMQFKVADGLTPTDRLISGDTLAVAVQTMGSSPEINRAYNTGPAFSYLMKTRGVDLSSFEKSQEQLAYEQALGSWQSMTQLALEKGVEIELGPMPTPEQFGYVPANNDPANTNKDKRGVTTDEQQQ